VISHDREFLDAITSVTLHIDNAKLVRYGGNYSAFEDMRAEQMLLQQSAMAKQAEKIAHLQSFIDRFKAKASKAKQAQSRVKALDRMEKIAPVLADAEFTFEFQEPLNLPNPMLSMVDVSFGYPPPEAPGRHAAHRHRAQHQPLGDGRPAHRHPRRQRPGQIDAGQDHRPRAAPISGEVTEGKGLNIGYFAQQELDVLRPQDTPLEHMVRLAKEAIAAGRSGVAGPRAGSAQLPRHLQFQRRHGQAAGRHHERRRKGPAGAVHDRLATPQPAAARRADQPPRPVHPRSAGVALNEFEGTVMLVSHDRALLRAVCDEFWLVTRGGIEPFDGDLDDYQRYLLDEAKRSREAIQNLPASSNLAASCCRSTPARTTCANCAKSSTRR
jgi:ATP-binding cassette subfamily F protein 3